MLMASERSSSSSAGKIVRRFERSEDGIEDGVEVMLNAVTFGKQRVVKEEDDDDGVASESSMTIEVRDRPERAMDRS